MGNTVIIIPTYFGNTLLTNCITSIMKNVSNAEVAVYKNDEGWVKACNKMMYTVPTSDVILLNDDTFILTDIVKEMEALAYSSSEIGIVGGKSLSTDGTVVINYGIYVSPDGNTAHRHYGKWDSDVTEPEFQQAIEGSCMFIKREVLNKIGLFDEGYGMGYREEVDLCFRAREAGYKIVSAPNAKYIHFTSQTNSKLGIVNSTHDYFMSKWSRKLQLGLV